MKKIAISGLTLATIVLLGIDGRSQPSLAGELDKDPDRLVQLQLPEYSDRRAITVFADGVATAPADLVQLQFSFYKEVAYDENGVAIEQPEPELDGLRQKVTQALNAIGIPSDRIQVIEQPQALGYAVEVLVDSPEASTAKIEQIDTAVQNAVEEIESLNLSSTSLRGAILNCQSLERAARQKALDRAKIRAQEIASSIGATLGEIVFVLDASTSTNPYDACLDDSQGRFPDLSLGGYGSWTPYAPNRSLDIEIRSSLGVTYEIR
jgi:uncharacterized protein YggE